MTDIVLADIRRNAHEVTRVALRTPRNGPLGVDLRLVIAPPDKSVAITDRNKGLFIRGDLLRAHIEALVEAERLIEEAQS